jgi:hypothetical protein
MSTQLIHRLQRFFKPALDPRRSLRLSRKFDDECGYGAYHDACRARFERAQSATPDGDSNLLERRGFEHVHVMDAGTAEALRAELESRFEMQSVKKDKPELVGYDIDDEAFRDRLITAALPAPVDDLIARHFGSEYRVHYFQVTRTEAGGGTASFRWHCDQGPSLHLKLIVYLNDSREHGGNTEFLDLAASEALARIGYLFGPTTTRTDDLSDVLAREDLEYRPESRDMAPGDGVLFQPARAAHRGVSPLRGQRTALTLCLIPSTVHWREALSDGEMFDLKLDEKWHADARTLLQPGTLRSATAARS